ncbi:T9SS type A sorting domain-containing protein [Bacteroidota bacterium]
MAQSATTFNVSSNGFPVKGIWVGIAGISVKTDASGDAVLYLPDGEYDLIVFTTGSPETIIIDGKSITYKDIGGNGSTGRYDNIFVYDGSVSVSGETTKDIVLPHTTFYTTVDGSAGSVEFDVSAEYSGGKTKVITTVGTDASGTISLPLPTHRDTRNGDTLVFSDFKFSASFGSVSGTFVPASGLVTIATDSPSDITLNVTAGGTAVEGITVDIMGVSQVTDAAGQTVFSLPDGNFTYNIQTAGTPEFITIGSNTFTYNDIGGNDRPDSYDNIFVYNGSLSVSGTATEDIALTTTTFNTTVAGSLAALDFDITADHDGGGSDTKTLTSVNSGAGGSISLPLPSYRSTRNGDTLMFINHEYSAVFGIISDSFDPNTSPVDIVVPNSDDVIFNVTSGGTPVEGITVAIMGLTQKTDASGQAILNIPDGNYSYSVFTEGTPETIKVGDETFTYKDFGGRGTVDSYDNYFVYDKSITVSGASSEDVSLMTTTFSTTIDGSAASVDFDITAEFDGGGSDRKVLSSVSSDASGTIALPLPTYRDSRRGNFHEFIDYMYISDTVTATFDPNTSPVAFNIHSTGLSKSDVTFTVTAGGEIVRGITIDVMGVRSVTDESGEAVLSLPNGDFPYTVYTTGTPETIIVGTNSITYNDIGGDGKVNSYDNYFVYDDTVTVSGTSTKTVDLLTTTFNTSVDGTAASIEFDVTAQHAQGGSHRKTIANLTSSSVGTITLPIPPYRDDKDGDIFEFIDYMYSAAFNTVSGSFGPFADTAINIDVPVSHEITFNVTAGGTAVEGISVGVIGVSQKTDASGQVVFSLPEGDFGYKVFTYGSPEVLTIGSNMFTYADDGGRDRPDRYDNIFVESDTVNVSGPGTENIALTTTTFNTKVNDSPASVEFEISAGYYNSGGDYKRKVISVVTSDAGGIISLPLPTHRDDRNDNILAFSSYSFSDMLGSIVGLFFPNISPVNINIPSQSALNLTVTSGSDNVEGITIGLNKLMVETDASGQAVLDVPDGEYEYYVFTPGTPEELIIGGKTISYQDQGGDNNEIDSYDNIFAMGTVIVSGTTTLSIPLVTTTFNTKINATPAQLTFGILGDYLNPEGSLQTKLISTVSSNASGIASLPLPTHRTSRVGIILEFTSFRYTDLVTGDITGTFDPAVSPVNVDFPAHSDVTINVTGAGTAVEGITVGVNYLDVKTDATGQAVLQLPDGDHQVKVYTAGKPETLTFDGKTFTYKDAGGSSNNDGENHYDNLFKIAPITVSGPTTIDIAIIATTFNTSTDGFPVPVSFNVSADYFNRDGDLKTKTIISATSDNSGSIVIPLPSHRDDRRENLLPFFNYTYTVVSGFPSGIFDPYISPVAINVDGYEVTFVVSDDETSDPIQGAIVSVSGVDLTATDASGETSVNLADGTYNYTVSSDGYHSLSAASFTVDGTDLLEVVSMSSSVGVESNIRNSFRSYPNPSNEYVTLKFSEEYSGSIELISMSGKLVMQEQAKDVLSKTIDVSMLQSGTYIMKVGIERELLILK